MTSHIVCTKGFFGIFLQFIYKLYDENRLRITLNKTLLVAVIDVQSYFDKAFTLSVFSKSVSVHVLIVFPRNLAKIESSSRLLSKILRPGFTNSLSNMSKPFTKPIDSSNPLPNPSQNQ